ncbi:MAG: class I SAM-dependent methyltransferase [Planctomycetota bacterium]
MPTVASAGTREDVRTCQLCGSEERELMFAEPPYEVLRCAGCGLVYVTPRLTGEALREVYGESYWRSDAPKTKGYADYAKDAPLYLKTFRRRFGLLRRRLGEGKLRILDVGCAAGFFLRVCRELGHDGYGVEISQPIAELAQQELGRDRVWIGDLDSAIAQAPTTFAPHSFDLLTMWDVVEHVPDPQALLRQARTLLKPGGHLVIETQNVASRFARTLGPRWQHYKHEEHLYHFDPRTARMLVEQAGYELLSWTPSYGGKYVSFAFISERAARLNRLAAFCLKPLGWFKGANVYLNFRDEMILFAKPKAD